MDSLSLCVVKVPLSPAFYRFNASSLSLFSFLFLQKPQYSEDLLSLSLSI